MVVNSMTGFGRAELTSRVGTVTVEISGVNNRFLDISVRMPRQFSALEPRIRELVTAKLNRGNVVINIGLDEGAGALGRHRINEAAARSYLKHIKALQKELKLPGEVTMRDLLLLPDIAGPEQERVDMETVWEAFRKVIARALADMAQMRRSEGQAMLEDMRGRLAELTATVREILKQTANSVSVYRDKLAARINELLEPSQRGTLRLEEEIAVFAERTDITEECTRFLSHIDQYSAALKAKEPVGKRLNFILQEMNREANTIGSKCADFSITTLVIKLKEEVERLRELVQNVE
jgi:uncharacterized protein (TIGR00255 family)